MGPGDIIDGNVSSVISLQRFQLALPMLHDATYDPDNNSIGSGCYLFITLLMRMDAAQFFSPLDLEILSSFAVYFD